MSTKSMMDVETVTKTPWWVSLTFTAMLLVGVGCQKDKQMEESSTKTTESEQKDETMTDNEKKDESVTDKMAAEHEGDAPTETGFADLTPEQPVTTQEVTYATVDGQEVSGFYAKPKKVTGEMPGIIAIHEWWGLNDNIKHVSKLLAGRGYQVLAVDMYGGEVAETPSKAKELMQNAMKNKGQAEANLSGAYEFLSSEKAAPKVASIGWCFGGGWSLRTALMLPKELDASVIYYGELQTDVETLEPLEMPVIGFFGSEDSAIPPSKVEAFESAMNEAGNEVTVHMYEGANHAFANPSGKSYDAEAAMDAWKKTMAFLEKHLAVEAGASAEPESAE